MDIYSLGILIVRKITYTFVNSPISMQEKYNTNKIKV